MEADAASAAPTGDRVAVGGDGESDAPFEFACRSDQLSRDDARLQVEIRGRYLALLRRGDHVYAMDATCYHMGAPLLYGDIEDIPGHGACITCPWHHYQISMTTGERLYQDMTRKTCTLPKKQRVHATKIGENGDVYVRLSGGGKPLSPTIRAEIKKRNSLKPSELPKPEWESDRYAFKPPPPTRGGSAGGKTKIPSGLALRKFADAGSRGSRPESRGVRDAQNDEVLGDMVAHSMRGGDGKAPWAMRGNVPENSETLSSRPSLPAPVVRPTRLAAPTASAETASAETASADTERDSVKQKNSLRTDPTDGV